ncbi:hypothetical protein BH09PAT1_BH09PAT1_4270 [soil metagenome]
MPTREEFFDPGIKSMSNLHWLPWLQKQLLINSILAQTPEMPEPYVPVYEKWLAVLKQFDINEDTILVGHSCGAGFLVRFLSEHKIHVGKVALVAPWIDPDKTLTTGFFNFDIGKDLASRSNGFKMFYSTDDSSDIVSGVKLISKTVEGSEIKEYSDKGHFVIEDMKTVEFPELKEFLLL